MTILIADDCESIRLRIEEMLINIDGVDKVLHARDVKEAVEYTKEHNPDIVILDISMPGNGMIALGKIKNHSKAIAVIMFTNYAYQVFKERCYELGADFFFDKSAEFDKIPAVVKQLISESNIEINQA